MESYPDDKVMQVFLCHRCDPQQYMKVKINASIGLLRVAIVCPYCNHKHPRTIKFGEVIDDRGGSDLEDIIVMKSACQTTDPMANIKNTCWGHANVVPRSAYTEQCFREAWLNTSEREKGNL